MQRSFSHGIQYVPVLAWVAITLRSLARMERRVVLSESCPDGTGGKLIWPGDLSAILGTSSNH